jgi:cytochrome c biogenesis protein CcdA
MNPLDPYSYLNELNHWVDSLPLAYAFGAGMIASINPCGFLMLPSYAGFYLGTGGETANPRPISAVERGGRALLLGALVTLGFIAVFGSIGLIVASGGRWIVDLFPWSGLVIGSGLIVLGLWLLLPGKSLNVSLLQQVRVERRRSPSALFAFGIAYAVASLGCTLPIFLIIVTSALNAQGLFTAIVQFLNYALGMGLVLTTVTLSLAYFEGALTGPIHRAMPVVERAGPAFLILAGTYLVYYWAQYGRLLI